MDYINRLKWKKLPLALTITLFCLALGIPCIAASGLFDQGFKQEIDWMMIIVGAAFVIGGLISVILTLTGHYQKHLRAKLEQMFGSNRSGSNEFMAFMLEKALKFKYFRLARGYMITRINGFDRLYDSKDLVWVYIKTTTHKLYGLIPIGKSHCVVLALADGKRHECAMSKKQAQQLQAHIKELFPGTVVGYGDKIEAIYQNNRQLMGQVAAAQRNPQQ